MRQLSQAGLSAYSEPFTLNGRPAQRVRLGPFASREAAEAARVLRPGGRALFIYPAEPIMGMYAIPTSVILHGTPFKAREVHCQKLWPAKLRRMVAGLSWLETHREFNLLKSPQFVSRFAAV